MDATAALRVTRIPFFMIVAYDAWQGERANVSSVCAPCTSGCANLHSQESCVGHCAAATVGIASCRGVEDFLNKSNSECAALCIRAFDCLPVARSFGTKLVKRNKYFASGAIALWRGKRGLFRAVRMVCCGRLLHGQRRLVLVCAQSWDYPSLKSLQLGGMRMLDSPTSNMVDWSRA